ncbi:MAG: taurine dioxygenase [Rhodospirillaceae bacterium]|nr:taurine dioxygenase [Rhodospirillaceae bacterium]
MNAAAITIRPIAGALGSEIFGVDIAGDLDNATWAAVRRAFLDYGVIFFRDQDMTPDQQIAFARRFGALADYPFAVGLEDHLEITEVIKNPGETNAFGALWHADTTYMEKPPMATMLLARETPTAGGDTQFANMALAFQTLSVGMQGLLSGLRVVQSSGARYGGDETRETRKGQFKSVKMKGAGNVATTHVHPAVRTHPETGAKGLYVNSAHTLKIDGMSEAESRPLLDFLLKHLSKPEFTCRFAWRPGSVAIWDNRAVQHFAINDYDARRVMHRITIAGDTHS